MSLAAEPFALGSHNAIGAFGIFCRTSKSDATRHLQTNKAISPKKISPKSVMPSRKKIRESDCPVLARILRYTFGTCIVARLPRDRNSGQRGTWITPKTLGEIP